MKLLKFKDFVSTFTFVNEARVWAHPESTYVFNPTNHSKIPSNIFDLTFNSCKEEDMTGDHSMFYVSGNSRVKEIDHEESLKLLKKPHHSILKDNEGKNVFLIVAANTSILTEKKKSNETTTNVKEGLVVYFYYSNIHEMPNLENIEDIIEKLKGVSIPSESLDSKTVKEIKDYLDNLFIDKIAVKTLSDFWSVGYSLSTTIDNRKHTVLRTGLFDSLRKLGSNLTRLPADKWCPGDIYLADSSSLSLINDYISEIEKNIQEDSIAKLNDLFSDEPITTNQKGSAIGSIVAVSLKQEQAQAGKAKEFLKTLSKDQKEYNVTDDEYNQDDSRIESMIEDLRSKIASSCSKSNISINLQQETGYKNDDPIALRKKYASLKITAKLLENPSDIDDNILKSAAFAMSLTGVNPTFFKFIGSSKGNAKIDKFPKGDMIYLLDHGLGDKRTVVEIIDRNSSSEIIFKFRIKKGEDEKTVVMKCRPNGSKQSTLEIEKLK